MAGTRQRAHVLGFSCLPAPSPSPRRPIGLRVERALVRGGAVPPRHRGQRAGPRERCGRAPGHREARPCGVPLHDLLVAGSEATPGDGAELRRSRVRLVARRSRRQADQRAPHPHPADDRVDPRLGGRWLEGSSLHPDGCPISRTSPTRPRTATTARTSMRVVRPSRRSCAGRPGTSPTCRRT